MRFEPTVNLGQALQIAALVVTIATLVGTLDRRVTVLETLAKEYVPRVQALEKASVRAKGN